MILHVQMNLKKSSESRQLTDKNNFKSWAHMILSHEKYMIQTQNMIEISWNRRWFLNSKSKYGSIKSIKSWLWVTYVQYRAWQFIPLNFRPSNFCLSGKTPVFPLICSLSCFIVSACVNPSIVYSFPLHLITREKFSGDAEAMFCCRLTELRLVTSYEYLRGLCGKPV